MNRYLVASVTLFSFLASGCVNSGTSRSYKAVADTPVLVEVDSSTMEDPDMTELADIVYNFEKLYKDTFKIDTIFLNAEDSIHIYFKHFALKNDFISIPDKYTSIYKLKGYKANEFVSLLKIVKNDLILLDTLLEKKMFSSLPNELNEYGLLMFPNLHIKPEGIAIEYSISVPLTDVGKSASVFIDYKGNFNYR